jgi:hypothetical protein
MNLDARTPLGRDYVRRQSEVVARCAQVWQSTVMETPLEEPADVDAVFGRAGVVKVVAEVKVRNMTMAELETHGSYLVTNDKLVRGSRCAAAMYVPFVLVVGLWPERHIVYWRVWSPATQWCFDFDVRRTATQATCNGGQAVRENAYLPLLHMRRLG